MMVLVLEEKHLQKDLSSGLHPGIFQRLPLLLRSILWDVFLIPATLRIYRCAQRSHQTFEKPLKMRPGKGLEKKRLRGSSCFVFLASGCGRTHGQSTRRCSCHGLVVPAPPYFCSLLPGEQSSSSPPKCRGLVLKWWPQEFQVGFWSNCKMFWTFLRAGHCLCRPANARRITFDSPFRSSKIF